MKLVSYKIYIWYLIKKGQQEYIRFKKLPENATVFAFPVHIIHSSSQVPSRGPISLFMPGG